MVETTAWKGRNDSSRAARIDRPGEKDRMDSNPDRGRRSGSALLSRLATLAALAAPVPLLLPAAGCAGSDPFVTIEAAAFAPSIDGDVGISSSVSTDVDTINLQSQLGLGDREVVPYLRAGVNVARFDLALSGFRTSQSGHGTVDADFGDIIAGSNVDTDLDLGLVHGHVVYDLFQTKWATVGAGLAADYIDLQLDASDPTFMMEEKIDVRQIVPLVEARASFRLPVVPIDLDLELGAITGSYQDVNGTILDAAVMLHGRIAGPLSLFGGYRYVHFDLKGVSNSQSFDGDVVLSGFMFGASVRF
jgi:hypothetical protein